MKGLADKLEIALFKLFYEELRRHSDIQVSVGEADRGDRPEPGLKLLLGKIVMKNLKTIIPHLRMILLHFVAL